MTYEKGACVLENTRYAGEAMAERTDKIAMNVSLTLRGVGRLTLDDLAERFGMTKVAIVERVLQWLLHADEAAQIAVLVQPRGSARAAIAGILESMMQVGNETASRATSIDTPEPAPMTQNHESGSAGQSKKSRTSRRRKASH